MQTPRATAPLLVALILAFVGSVAYAVDRHPLGHRDSYLGEALLVGEFDEYTTELARGSTLTISFGRAAPGRLRPGVEFVNDNYSRVGVTPVGAGRLRTATISRGGRYRFLIGGVRGTVGGYRVAASIQPGRVFVLKAKPKFGVEPKRLEFGSYAGFEADLTVKWKGDTPLGVTLTAPDGTDVELPTPVTKKSALIYRGLPTEQFGDYRVDLDVPEGTAKWSAKVKVKGSLDRGEQRDVRRGAQPRTLELVTRGFLLTPVVRVRGETGGPNDIGLTGSINGPEPQVTETAVRCARAIIDGARPATHYRLSCSDGTNVEVTELVENGDGRALSYVAEVRSPAGRGTSRIQDVEYDDDGRPTSWTEQRSFASTGRTHELRFSAIDRFSNGVIRGYTVEHTPPDGPTRSYDYAPIDLPNQ